MRDHSNASCAALTIFHIFHTHTRNTNMNGYRYNNKFKMLSRLFKIEIVLFSESKEIERQLEKTIVNRY